MRLYHEGVSAFRMRQLTLAKERLSKLITGYPKDIHVPMGKFELAKVLIDLREFDRAVELLVELSELQEGSFDKTEARRELISLLARLQRFRQGVEILEIWWKDQPGNPVTGRDLARFYLQSGRSDEAKLLLEGMLEKTASRQVFADLLDLSIKTGEVESLMNAIENRRMRYRTGDYLDFTSDCLLALHKDDKAAEMLRDAPETQNSPELLRKLARLDLRRKDHANALESFRNLRSFTGLEWEVIKSMGYCLLQLGKKQEAIAEWKTYIDRYKSLESYQRYIEVLIANRLYEESLNAFTIAREFLRNPAQFARERAGVLEILGRSTEALEEYLKALELGGYNQEIFDKLYKNQSESFNFLGRLRETMAKRPAVSIKKAILEIHMIERNVSAIPELVNMNHTGSIFDDLIYERLRQEVFYEPSDFYHSLVTAFIRRNRHSTLAFKLSEMLLSFQNMNDDHSQIALEEALETEKAEPCPDLELKIKLQSTIGKFYFERYGDMMNAEKYLQNALREEYAAVAPEVYFDSLLTMSRLKCASEDYDRASQLQKQAETFLDSGQAFQPAAFPVFAPNQLRLNTGSAANSLSFLLEEEAHTRLIFEKAFLAAHQGKYQDALNELKIITQDHPESLLMDDALDLALFITMGSAGGPDALNAYLEAERRAMSGKFTEAVSEMEKIAGIASDTTIALDAEAKILLYSKHLTDRAGLTDKIDAFRREHPGHWLGAELLNVKWQLARNESATEAEKSELLKEFVDRYPTDLRSRHMKLILSDMLRENK